jgi:heme/copper-type cytochrome/quinol oxidase subunit 2
MNKENKEQICKYVGTSEYMLLCMCVFVCVLFVLCFVSVCFVCVYCALFYARARMNRERARTSEDYQQRTRTNEKTEPVCKYMGIG